MDARRLAHPTVTWTEIEAAVDAQLGALRAQMLGDSAMASVTTTLRGERPACPACGAPLQAAGTSRRRLHSEQDEPIALERTYARCPACGSGVFPRDEELGLLPGTLTPTLQAHFSRAEAAHELGYLKGVTVSATTARRHTEGAVRSAEAKKKRKKTTRKKPKQPSCAATCHAACDFCFHRADGPLLCDSFIGGGALPCNTPCSSDNDCVGSDWPYCVTLPEDRATGQTQQPCISSGGYCLSFAACGP